MSALIYQIAVTISSGSYLSSAAEFKGQAPNVLQMPAGWDAADISFTLTSDGTFYHYAYDENGDLITIPTGASRRINLPSTLSRACGIKVCSGVPGTTVNQTAERVLYLEYWS